MKRLGKLTLEGMAALREASVLAWAMARVHVGINLGVATRAIS
jgi:hypothetical protein